MRAVKYETPNGVTTNYTDVKGTQFTTILETINPEVSMSAEREKKLREKFPQCFE